jgi:subtilase family protein
MRSMGDSKQVSRLGAILLPMGAALFAALPHNANADESWRARVATGLQSVYDMHTRRQMVPATGADTARFDARGRVEADVHYDCAAGAPNDALAAVGLSVSSATHLPPLCIIEGWIAPGALPQLVAVSGVTQVKIPSYARPIQRPTLKSTAATQTGSAIDGNAVTIMHADEFVRQAGGGGNGVIVGVQSQGVASLSTLQGRGELPSVNVLTAAAGASATAADEGTALLQEIHAVAPNAGLAFCEPQTFVQYTACLQQFVRAGATILVDDILFFDQDPMSSGGTDAAGVTQFLVQNPNVALFTAGGNDNGSYWEGTYTPVDVSSLGLSTITCPGSTQVDHYVNQFSSAADEILTITPTVAISVPLTFAWSDPPGQNSSKFDIYWTNPNSTAGGCVSTASAGNAVLTQTVTLFPGPNKLYIATPDASAAGKFLKLWVGGDGLTALSISTAGSFVSPQTFATGVVSIGAVNGSDGIGNNIESFSSRGPITVVFPGAARIPAPILVAPDGIYVDTKGTYFASEIFPDGNFYGTSAAAPNAAAVAALIRGAFPGLTTPQLLSALETGATQLAATVPDNTFGYGRVDAMGALGTFAAPTMTTLPDVSIDASSSRTSAALPFKISGTGTLHFSVTSTNPTLIPESAGTSSAPGISVSPADCGSPTLTCTLTVTAAQYQGGTATVTVSAVDGAGRAAPATTHVTVTNPQTAPPPPPPAPATGSSGGGGGSLSLWEVCAALLALAARLTPRLRTRTISDRTA